MCIRDSVYTRNTGFIKMLWIFSAISFRFSVFKNSSSSSYFLTSSAVSIICFAAIIHRPFNQKNEICRILTYFLIIKFFNANVKQNAKYWQQSTYMEKVRQASSIHRFYLFFQTAHIRILQFDLLKNYCTLSALSSLNCTVFRVNTVQNKNTPFQSPAALFCQSR